MDLGMGDEDRLPKKTVLWCGPAIARCRAYEVMNG
jgi:hypothetical protein